MRSFVVGNGAYLATLAAQSAEATQALFRFV
jgi:hypothetical protein